MNQTPGTTAVRILRPLAGAVAILLCATACGSAAKSTASAGAASSSGASATGASAKHSGGGADRSTPDAALSHWLKQIVKADYSAACKDLVTGAGSSPLPVPTASALAVCASTLTHLHDNFTTDGITTKSTITASGAKVTGVTATIDGTDVQVSGSTLTALVLAHSTGVSAGQLSISFKLSQTGGEWYVSDFNLNV